MRNGFAAVVVAVTLVSSCGSGASSSSSSATTGSAPTGVSGSADGVLGTTDAGQQAAVAVVTQELQGYLDSWRATGLANAAHLYLGPDQQLPSASGGASPVAPLVLARGRVTAVALQSWTSSELFVVRATLTLVLGGSGDTLGNWSNGPNERFVTVERRTGAVPYVLSFATSP
jgi:hypothetical protein